MRQNPKHLHNPFCGLVTLYPSCYHKYYELMLFPEMNEGSKTTCNTQGPIAFQHLLECRNTHGSQILGTTSLPTRKMKIDRNFNSLAASCIRPAQYFLWDGLFSYLFNVLHCYLTTLFWLIKLIFQGTSQHSAPED